MGVNAQLHVATQMFLHRRMHERREMSRGYGE